jgi:hypothetical protein
MSTDTAPEDQVRQAEEVVLAPNTSIFFDCQ